MSRLADFLSDLKRRRAFRVAGVYVVAGWVVVQGLDGWREDQVDRGILLQHLGALADEFEQTAMIIDTELQGVERSMEGTRSLLEMMGPDAAPNPDSARAALETGWGT